MGASLTRLCASCTTSSPHHSPKCVVHSRACCYPPYSYSTLLLVCLSSTPQLPQPAFLSLFTTSSLSLPEYSLTTCECSAFLSLCFFSHNQNFPFIQTAAAVALSSSTLLRITLFLLFYCTCTVSCSISRRLSASTFFRIFSLNNTSFYCFSNLHTHTFFLQPVNLRWNSAPPIPLDIAKLQQPRHQPALQPLC